MSETVERIQTNGIAHFEQTWQYQRPEDRCIDVYGDDINTPVASYTVVDYSAEDGWVDVKRRAA